jgi:hypothetical protein
MSLVLQSSGGGSVTIAEPTTASDFTQNLPAVSGNIVTTGDSGTITQGMLATAASSIGVSQNWTDVIGSRALSITYTNSTGKPIMVWVGGTCTAGNEAAVGYVNVNGVNLGPTSGAAGAKWQTTFIVPNGQTYYVTANSGTPSLEQWVELR